MNGAPRTRPQNTDDIAVRVPTVCGGWWCYCCAFRLYHFKAFFLIREKKIVMAIAIADIVGRML